MEGKVGEIIQDVKQNQREGMYQRKKNDLVPLCRRFIISLVGVPEKELKIYWRKILKKKIKEFSRTESRELPD